ncbi:MAG: hypothetical protein AAF430_24020 [Myxococcota bacterium]
MSGSDIGLPEALERAASELGALADVIRPANGDPGQLAHNLSADQAQELLGWLLSQEPEAGAELALAWAEEPELASTVLSFDPAALPKPARKALRRVLHRLRSQGVAVAAPAETKKTVATLAPVEDAVDEARITALDPQGVRLAYLATDRPGGGVRLFELALDEARGVVDFDVYETGRSRARKFLRDSERRKPWATIEVERASLQALIGRVAGQQSGERPAPRTFAEWRSRLTDVPADTATPGAQAVAALDAAESVDRETLDGWIETGQVGPWPPRLERVQSLIDALSEIGKGVVVVSEAAREEQIDAALERGLDEIYDADERERMAHRFDETAYVWWKQGETDDARIALAVAAGFRDDAFPQRATARRLLERLLAPALQRAREGEDADDASPSSGESA